MSPMTRSTTAILLSYPLLSRETTSALPGPAVTDIRDLAEAKSVAGKTGRPLAILVADSLSDDMEHIETGRIMLHELAAFAVVVHSDNAMKGGAHLPDEIRLPAEAANADMRIPYALIFASAGDRLVTTVTADAVKDQGAAAFGKVGAEMKKAGYDIV